ncbi:MAG: hypothetical protein ABH896_03600 [Candidatus Jacksonbacteria bacterium]
MSTSSNILRRKEKIYQQILENKQIRLLGSELLLIILIGLYLHGIILGMSLGWQPLHFITIATKMLILAIGTTALCTPTLYVFSALRGGNIALKQVKLLLIGMLSTISLVLLGFLPIVWFFIFTSGDNVKFIAGMNIVVLIISTLFGFWFLQNGIKYLYQQYKKTDSTAQSGLDVLLVWFLIFSAVAIQMYLELSPWFKLTTGFFK